LIYLIFYPQRRYKRRIKKAKKEYKKRALLGGVVGLCKGFVAGLICLSFLGSSLYVIAGGNGEGKLVEHSFGDESYDMAYNTYRSIDSYGTTGIYKVLNVFKDKDDQPFYLFAADLVFSAKLEDENFGIDENIKFREEAGAYIGFAKDTVNLLLKYGGEDINEVYEYLKSSGVRTLGGVNGDFFSVKTGVPNGHVVVDKKIVSTDERILPALGIREDGSAFISDFQIITKMLNT
jgi:hypothetical protein